MRQYLGPRRETGAEAATQECLVVVTQRRQKSSKEPSTPEEARGARPRSAQRARERRRASQRERGRTTQKAPTQETAGSRRKPSRQSCPHASGTSGAFNPSSKESAQEGGSARALRAAVWLRDSAARAARSRPLRTQTVRSSGTADSEPQPHARRAGDSAVFRPAKLEWLSIVVDVSLTGSGEETLREWDQSVQGVYNCIGRDHLSTRLRMYLKRRWRLITPRSKAAGTFHYCCMRWHLPGSIVLVY